MVDTSKPTLSLRRVVLARTGQDLRRCQSCYICDDALAEDANEAREADIPISSLIQLVLLNDDEVLTCRTLWSDAILARLRRSCQQGFDLAAVILALRSEAEARNLTGGNETHIDC